MQFDQLQTQPFRDRHDAGRQLALKLAPRYRHRPDTIVLALPRGGVPIAHEVTIELEMPLDLCLVRKLGVPGHPELAMGAIAASGVRVLNQELIDRLGIPLRSVDRVTAAETLELERRERAYLQGRQPSDLTNKTVILVDDGVATGATLRAAIVILKQSGVKSIVIAVPVAHPGVVATLRREVDAVVCVMAPDPLQSISLWYDQFDQTSDDTVRAILRQHDAEFSADAPP